MEIYASHLIPDEQFKSRKGTYVSDDDYDILLTRDCDVYDSASKPRPREAGVRRRVP